MSTEADGWQKCASVTPGGKPYFYYHPQKRLWVVWSRFDLKWVIESEQGFVRVQHGFHHSANAAMTAADSINAETKKDQAQ